MTPGSSPLRPSPAGLNGSFPVELSLGSQIVPCGEALRHPQVPPAGLHRKNPQCFPESAKTEGRGHPLTCKGANIPLRSFSRNGRHMRLCNSLLWEGFSHRTVSAL
ncbi:Hypothetical predicted protein [Podarcis lilfordi]|uniref:Uncharacterized protein n=1 Tax=Podarcis lilfordi TaxID=74358 RepID=A0AA35QQG8_9SAUR|nr:Hypothetical predicted protein [Podarcis lilfordi]